ncbi:FUSC family protein [Microbacterium sp. LRZ72]|uniref:FUSC family protein n=1 Tax=Microbacterium sp. LRZ72 TaxID=2942481 RepID=UPI0029AF712D|nr:FUSC family protein [Microbacterium sp. LRZ72]MDX2375957.1 FUSC family protein [Microbacterium sp. LRZ72]
MTAAIPVRLRDRFDPRPGLARLRRSAGAILQIVVAATAAYAFSVYVLGHPAPLLAATVTVSSLGLVRDARPRRVLQTVTGMLVGVLIAEAIVLTLGHGAWQLALTLLMTLATARLLSPQPGFAIAAAIQSVIVLVMPVSVGAPPITRLSDAVVGAVAALLVTALIPRNPRAEAARDVRAVFLALDDTVAALTQALRRGSRARAERALEKARAIDPLIGAWREALDSTVAVARISPWLRGRRDELGRQQRIVTAMDLAARNLRVIARRAAYVADDGAARPTVADVLEGLARGIALIGESVDDIAAAPLAREEVLAIARHLDPREMAPEAGLGDQNLIATLRPLAVDLLVASGMTRDDARAAIPRL